MRCVGGSCDGRVVNLAGKRTQGELIQVPVWEEPSLFVTTDPQLPSHSRLETYRVEVFATRKNDELYFLAHHTLSAMGALRHLLANHTGVSRFKAREL